MPVPQGGGGRPQVPGSCSDEDRMSGDGATAGLKVPAIWPCGLPGSKHPPLLPCDMSNDIRLLQAVVPATAAAASLRWDTKGSPVSPAKLWGNHTLLVAIQQELLTSTCEAT